MLQTKGYAATDPQKPLSPYAFTRREPHDRDVVIRIEHCGICHSDLHQVRDEWGGAKFPMVPGHEIVGTVVRAGKSVSKVREGDRVGVGCMVGSCGDCAACKAGDEPYCEKQVVWTYNSTDKDGQTTQGGYSTQIVVDEAFVLRVAKDLPAERVAPLLCAGITTYSPLVHWKVTRGQRVGVVGLGGLGHMAVKIAAAMGAEVTLFSHSEKKRADAKRLGANDFVIASDQASMQKHAGRLDLIIDTVSARHDFDALLSALRTDGTLVLVGLPEGGVQLNPFSLVARRRRAAGSLIGGIKETQEMLDFCAKHEVLADVESIPATGINDAYERMLKGDVRYRFVIDASTF